MFTSKFSLTHTSEGGSDKQTGHKQTSHICRSTKLAKRMLNRNTDSKPSDSLLAITMCQWRVVAVGCDCIFIDPRILCNADFTAKYDFWPFKIPASLELRLKWIEHKGIRDTPPNYNEVRLSNRPAHPISKSDTVRRGHRTFWKREKDLEHIYPIDPTRSSQPEDLGFISRGPEITPGPH